jgi:hypothetical protein
MIPLRLLCLCLGSLLVACGSKDAPATAPAATGPMKVQQLEARRDGDHVLVRATLYFTNPTKEAVTLRAEAVSLLAGPDIVPAYTRPFLDYPTVEPGASGVTKLEYWAEARQLTGSLRLKYQSQVLTIKGDAEFKIEQLPEGQMVFLSWPEWRVQ